MDILFIVGFILYLLVLVKQDKRHHPSNQYYDSKSKFDGYRDEIIAIQNKKLHKPKKYEEPDLYIGSPEWYRDKQEYLESDKWARTRQTRLDIDSNECVKCGEKNKLEIHHITYKRLFNENIYDLVTLCRSCHQEVHDKLGYSPHGTFNIE